MSLILVTLTSRSDSYFESSNISFEDNIYEGIDLNANGLTATFERANKILRLSAE